LELVAEVVPALRSEYGFWAAIRRRMGQMDFYDWYSALIIPGWLLVGILLVVLWEIVKSVRS
jgi:hypothetical protein